MIKEEISYKPIEIKKISFPFKEIAYFGDGNYEEAKEIAENNSEGRRIPNGEEVRYLSTTFYYTCKYMTGYPYFYIWYNNKYEWSKEEKELVCGHSDVNLAYSQAPKNKKFIFMVR